MKRMKIKKNNEYKSIFTKRLLEKHNSITIAENSIHEKGN
jgi:hypothetical protein